MSEAIKKDWVFDVYVERIVDADTLDVLIDVGFGVQVSQRLRLVGPFGVYFDAWEVRGSERTKGLEASAFVEALLSTSQRVQIRTYMESGKYGRYLAQVLIDGEDLATALWNMGHAKRLGDERR